MDRFVLLRCLRHWRRALRGVASASHILSCLAQAVTFQCTSPSTSRRFVRASDVYEHAWNLAVMDQEHVVLLCLDAKSHLLHEEVISKGTADSTILHARDVFRSAIRHNAVSVILIHNHPSGDPAPSQADLDRTRQIHAAAECVGIGLHDHVIVGNGSYCSLRTTHPDLFGERRTDTHPHFFMTD